MDVETKLFSLKHTTALTDVRKENECENKKKLGWQLQQKEKRNATDDASE